jgi:hypothetical protein
MPGAPTSKKKLRVLTSGDAKTVLPEVLPDPRRPAAAAEGARTPGSPRARTMAHLQKLLATAAAPPPPSATSPELDADGEEKATARPTDD